MRSREADIDGAGSRKHRADSDSDESVDSSAGLQGTRTAGDRPARTTQAELAGVISETETDEGAGSEGSGSSVSSSQSSLARRGGVSKRNKRASLDTAASAPPPIALNLDHLKVSSPASPEFPTTPLGALAIISPSMLAAAVVNDFPADLAPQQQQQQEGSAPMPMEDVIATATRPEPAAVSFAELQHQQQQQQQQTSAPGTPKSVPASPSRKTSGSSLLQRAPSNPSSPKPKSTSASPANSRPGTPTSTAGFLQTIFDAASRMVGAPSKVVPAGFDRRDLPPLPSAFHDETSNTSSAPSQPQLPSKLIIAPAKNVVTPVSSSNEAKKLQQQLQAQLEDPAIVITETILPSQQQQPLHVTIVHDAESRDGVTPILSTDGEKSSGLTESPTAENFASPADGDASRLSPSRAEKYRRRRRNPKSPVSPGPPPESENDTPTPVRTRQEEMEIKMDGEAEGVQEAGVEVAVSPQDGVVLRWQSGDDLFLLDNQSQEEANLPPLPSPLPPLTTPILWTVRQQQGYRKPPGHPLNVPSLQRQPLHQKCEDVHGPSLPPETIFSDSASGVHPINHNAYHLFVLADGHGGHGAAEWFVPRIRDQVEELLRKEDWEFSVETQRCKFGEIITSIFADLDREYCDMKIAEFEAWKRECTGLVSTVGIGSGALNAQDLAKRPADDGCTLIVNLIYRFHLLNCNVGDSRTVLARRWVPPKPQPVQTPDDEMETDSDEEEEDDEPLQQRGAQGKPMQGQQAGTQAPPPRASFNWTIHFASKDHSPDHPHRAHHIHRAGGLFINDDGTRRAVRIQPPHERGDMLYTELTGSRIYRPPNDMIKALGISHLKTLNLAGTMGDLLFKIAPAVISSRPDITFVRIRDVLEEGSPEKGGWEHLIVYTTDGVWDHLRQQSTSSLQNKAVIGFISGWMDRLLTYGPGVVGAGARGGPIKAPKHDRSISADADPDELGRALGTVASMMCEREADYEPAMPDSEGNYQNTPGSSNRAPSLYYPFVGRFDDISVGLCYIPVGGMTAASQGGSWKGKESKVRQMNNSVLDIKMD